jgi:hypothetical protein
MQGIDPAMSSTKAKEENKSYLEKYGWPAWFTPVGSFALTVWIVSGVLLLVTTIVGTFFTATRVTERDAENDLWLLAGYALVVTLYGGTVCLLAAMNGYARMASAFLSIDESPVETEARLYQEALLPTWWDKSIVPVAIISLVQSGALLIALIYYLLTMGSIIPDTFYFVLFYVGFLTLLTIASLAGGLCLLIAANAFRKMQDSTEEST